MLIIVPVVDSGSGQSYLDITINADGSITPPNVNISTIDNRIYSFTGNIKAHYLKIERSNIIVDGNGFLLESMIEGVGVGGIGFWLLNVTNVTIKNTNINNFYEGIFLDSACNSTLYANNITSNNHGIWLYKARNNIICGNNISNSGEYGLTVYYLSQDNLVFANNINVKNRYAISLLLFEEQNSNIFYANNLGEVSDLFSTQVVNHWDNSSMGNYWNDYSSKYPNATEIDNTGIGDIPYVINAKNIDNYPLTNPINISSILSTPTIVEGRQFPILTIAFTVTFLVVAVVSLLLFFNHRKTSKV